MKVEAVKRGHERKNVPVGSLPIVELTSESICIITYYIYHVY